MTLIANIPARRTILIRAMALIDAVVLGGRAEPQEEPRELTAVNAGLSPDCLSYDWGHEGAKSQRDLAP